MGSMLPKIKRDNQCGLPTCSLIPTSQSRTQSQMSLQVLSILPAKFSQIHSIIPILSLFLHPDNLRTALIAPLPKNLPTFRPPLCCCPRTFLKKMSVDFSLIYR